MSELDGCKTEHLIDLVRMCSLLYDLSHPDYKDAVKKADAWKHIADDLHLGVDAVKLKWKNLRDSYVKYLKYLNGAPGSAKKFKNWPWATNLEFLRDTITTRQTVSNVQVVQVDEDTNDSASVTNSETQPLQVNEDTNDDDPQMPTPAKKRRPLIIEGNVDKILSYLQNKTDNRPKTNLDHTDQLFLNYSATFKKLSPRRQVILKMELAQMFGRAELADMDQISPSFSPVSQSSSAIIPEVLILPSKDPHIHSENQPRRESGSKHEQKEK